MGTMGSGEDSQFVFAKYDYTAQGNQVSIVYFGSSEPVLLSMYDVRMYLNL